MARLGEGSLISIFLVSSIKKVFATSSSATTYVKKENRSK